MSKIGHSHTKRPQGASWTVHTDRRWRVVTWGRQWYQSSCQRNSWLATEWTVGHKHVTTSSLAVTEIPPSAFTVFIYLWVEKDKDGDWDASERSTVHGLSQLAASWGGLILGSRNRPRSLPRRFHPETCCGKLPRCTTPHSDWSVRRHCTTSRPCGSGRSYLMKRRTQAQKMRSE